VDRRLHTNRWTVKLMCALFAMGMVQAYVVWKMTRGVTSRFSHYNFMRDLMQEFLTFDSKEYGRRRAYLRQGREPPPPPVPQAPFNLAGARVKHRMAKIRNGRSQVCRVCSTRLRDDDQRSPMKVRSGKKRPFAHYECRYMCVGCCHAPMHPECFTRVAEHHQPGALAHSHPRSQVSRVAPSPQSRKRKSQAPTPSASTEEVIDMTK
jgi:hypothetical protein